MKQVKITESTYSADHGDHLEAGAVVTVPDSVAERWLANGMASDASDSDARKAQDERAKSYEKKQDEHEATPRVAGSPAQRAAQEEELKLREAELGARNRGDEAEAVRLADQARHRSKVEAARAERKRGAHPVGHRGKE